MFYQDPAWVVVKSHLAGLRALVNLMIPRVSKETNHLYSKAAIILKQAIADWNGSCRDGQPDFSIMMKAERKLRKMELANHFETTRKYGNREHKRVRNEQEGRVGLLNKKYNLVGGISRNYMLIMYPMDDTEPIGKRGKKTTWGYTSRNGSMQIPVAHGGDFAELDLLDMTRSHGRELARKGFIYRADNRTLNRYAHQLNQRLTPFTDYVYTHGQYGRKEFSRPRNTKRTERDFLCADEILAEIVKEIEAFHGTKISANPKPSGDQTQRGAKETEGFFNKQVERLRTEVPTSSMYMTPKLLLWADFLQELIDKDILRARDVKSLHREVTRKSKWMGENHHQLLTDGFVSPWNLDSVVIDGDFFLDEGEDTLIVGELPLDTPAGRGRVDLAVFKRVPVSSPELPDIQTALQPIGVFEIKTHAAFNWEIRKKKTRPGQKRDKSEPRIHTRKRMHTDGEWEDVVASTPVKDAKTQLEYYEKGLIAGYRRLTGTKIEGGLLKGVFVLDSQQDMDLNRKTVISLLESLNAEEFTERMRKGSSRILVRHGSGENEKAALIIHEPSMQQVKTYQREGEPVASPPRYNPLEDAPNEDKQDILYVSARSSAKSGPTASWISRYYHGLQYLEETVDREAEVILLDLFGAFTHRELAELRLRVSHQPEHVQEFFSSIEIRDFSPDINDFLYKGQPFPILEDLIERTDNDRPLVLVVSGWEFLSDSCPPRLQGGLSELERILVAEANDLADTVLWFDEAPHAEETSFTYHQRTVIPFRNTSPHRHYVTDIVFNLPVRPYASTHRTPWLDDLRVIFELNKEEVNSKIVEAQPLQYWSARFRNEGRDLMEAEKKGSELGRQRLTAADIMQNKRLSKDLVEAATQLIPWVRDLHPKTFRHHSDHASLKGFGPQFIPLYGSPSSDGGILSRLRYRARERQTEKINPTLEDRFLPREEITHPRHFRGKNRPKVQPNKRTSRPPNAQKMVLEGLDEDRALKVELRRMRRVLRVLGGFDALSSDKGWKSFLAQFRRMASPENTGMFVLYDIVRYLESSGISEPLWKEMQWRRERWLSRGLRLGQRKELEALLESRPHLAHFYGNYLFILILAIRRMYLSLTDGDLSTLWEGIKSWQLEQLGFQETDRREGEPEPTFIAAALFSNLRKRARSMEHLLAPVQSDTRLGQLQTYSNEEITVHWLFIEDKYRSGEVLSGIFEGRLPLSYPGSMDWSETDHSVITNYADLGEPFDVYDLLIAEMKGIEYIWRRVEEGWQFLGELNLLRRKRNAVTEIWGVEFQLAQAADIPSLPRRAIGQENVGHLARERLRRIASLADRLCEVEIHLDIENEEYVVKFYSDGGVVDTLRFTETADLIETLRRPHREGVPLQNSKNPHEFMSWNRWEDIEYNDLQLLRPYVDRKTPYIEVEVPLPLTCKELLRRGVQEIKVVLSHDESLCPAGGTQSQNHANCWRLNLDTETSNPDLNGLASTPLSETDIASMMAAEELFFERGRYRLEFEYAQDPESRDGVVFRELWPVARAIGMKRLEPGTYLSMPEERLVWDIVPDTIGLTVPIRSTVTKENIDRLLMQFELPDWQVGRMVEVQLDNLREVVHGYFGDDVSPEEVIEDYPGLVRGLTAKLMQVKARELNQAGKGIAALEMKLRFLREAAKMDAYRLLEVADLLVDLAELQEKEGDSDYASELLDEAVETLEKYGKEHNDKSALVRADEVRKLKSSL